MQINRQNYESFFLQYADKALLPEQYAMVHDFILQNKDLAQDLQMLKATILAPEPIVFAHKNLLYKNEEIVENLKEKLLLKLDDELSLADSKAIEHALATNKYVKDSYEILLQTKLNKNDTIVFDNKQLLYRKKPATIIPFTIKLIAIAAAILGFGIFIALQLGTKPVGISIVSITKLVAKNNLQMAAIYNKKEHINFEKLATINNNKEPQSINNNTSQQINKTPLLSKQVFIKQPMPINKSTVLAYANSTVIEKIITNNTTALANNLAIKPTVAAASTTIATPLDTNLTALDINDLQIIALSAVDKSENKILFMDETDLKKTKVGSFFKKIKRVIERTANVEIGKNIQIANFKIVAQ